MKKYLLTIFLLFFVSTGWCIKISGGSSSTAPVNLFKGVQATFELWDSTPTALNLTDENFDNYSIGIGTITLVSGSGDGNFGNIIFDLGSSYTNVIVSAKLDIIWSSADAFITKFVDIQTSNNGTDWTGLGIAGKLLPGSYTSLEYHFGIASTPINARYIKVLFTTSTYSFNGFSTFWFYEFTATQYK